MHGPLNVKSLSAGLQDLNVRSSRCLQNAGIFRLLEAQIDEEGNIKNLIRCTVILGVSAVLAPQTQEYWMSWWLGIVQNQGPSETFSLLNLWANRDG